MCDFIDELETKRFGTVILKETNVRNYRTDLFYKFVQVLNDEGIDISMAFANHYNFSTTRRRGFYGQLKSSGHGFIFINYIKDTVKRIEGITNS